ncbi:MAG: DNA-processing protein DprA [Candidatus Pacebacteria bacterium]|nr:DNA-processing protein DprA [Candidatus Paceibacterota bacterium]
MTDTPSSPIPEPLREIPDPPKQLFVRGQLPSFDDYVYLTIVGSRTYTNYGKEVCETLIKGLAGYPIVIVSGLALGIDTIAHHSALRHKLKTVAMPGSGLSDAAIYPASNIGLAREILQAGGALVSEFKPDQESAPWTFPRRNRLMAGISQATLVIEATNKSGTRITAKLATEYNRDVFAVPGNIFSESSSGSNQLLREGATPITCAQDILREFGFDTDIENPAETLSDCTDEEKSVLALLASPTPRGELIRSLDMKTHEANALLSMMEIKGLIHESMGEIRRV